MMTEGIKTVGIICVRAGSKGIPNKNIRYFHKKPLLEWTINAAINAGVIDKIIVSTDSRRIADVALSCGAEVPGLRPKYLAQDNSDQFDTHAYIFKKLNFTDENSRIVILANNPFLSANLIKRMVDCAGKTGFKRLVTTAIKTRHPYYFQFELSGNLCSPCFKDEYYKAPINRNERELMCFPFFLGCAGIPSMLKSWEDYKAEMGKGFIPVFLNKKEAFDLDDEDDWLIAEAQFGALQRPNL